MKARYISPFGGRGDWFWFSDKYYFASSPEGGELC